MARVNVEDEIEFDPRFKALARRLGCEDRARGMLVRFWRTAQTHWGRGELVPRELFNVGDFGEILAVGLAEDRGTGFYARGSEERFAWYVQVCQAGKRRSKGPRNKNGQLISDKPADDQRPLDKTPAEDQRPDQLLTPTLTLTPSLSLSFKKERESDNAPIGASPSALIEIWNANRGALPAARLTPKRKLKAAARLKDQPDLAYWERVVRRLAASSFATGKNDRQWKADFGWLIANDENHVKVDEGKYDNREAQANRRDSVPLIRSEAELTAFLEADER